MGRIIPNANTYIGFAATLTGTISAPKIADITAAIDLTHYTTSINASATGNAVPTPAFDELFETSIVGTSAATFTADFYRDDATGASGDLAWITLPRGTSGYFIITRFKGKPTTVGDKCEVWPVTVLSRSMANMSSNTVEMFTVTCVVPVVPAESAVLAT